MPKARNGEGSVRARQTAGGTVYDVQLTVRDRTSGLSRRIFKGGFKTEKAALAWRSKTLAESNARGLVREIPITVPQVVEAWMLAHPDNAPTTQGTYERTLRNHIRPRLNVRVAGLTPADLREFVAGTAGAITHHGTDGSATNRVAVHMIRAALRWAARRDVGMIPANPLQDIPLGVLKAPRRRDAMPLEDAVKLLHAAQGGPSEVAWRLLLETGARRGEITALNWSDINFRTGVVSIRKIASPESGGRALSNRTKGKANREIPISPALLATLEALKKERGARASDAVVIDPKSRTRPSFNIIRKWWREDCLAAGITGHAPHSLRHTFATTALAAGVDVKVVSSILGHASTAVTSEIYTHVTGALQREAVLKVTDVIGKIAS